MTIKTARRLKTLSAQQIRALDRFAIESIGISSAVLMENAGRAVADEILRSLQKNPRAQVSVFCGLGNNAGDGFVAVRYLINAGIKTKTFLIGNPDHLKPDAISNFKILDQLKCKVDINPSPREYEKEIGRSVVLVDALFGVGLNRVILDPFKSVIAAMNLKQKRFIVSVDIPSGLDATTGKVYGGCIQASRTVTFTFAKRGFFLHEGPKHTGKVIIADIGIPVNLIRGEKYGA